MPVGRLPGPTGSTGRRATPRGAGTGEVALNALGTVRRYGPLVVAGAAVGIAAAVLLTWRTPPRYTSSTEFFLSAARPADTGAAYEGNLFTQDRLTSYATLLTSPQLAQRVVDDLHLPLTAGEVASEITATAVPSTVVIDVEVSDTSATRAQAIARSLGREFTTRVTALETPAGGTGSTVTVTTIEAATFDATPSGPGLTTNLWRFGGAGLALGLLAALAYARLSRRVETDDDVRTATGTDVIGRIPSARAWRRRRRPLSADRRSLTAYRALAARVRRGRSAGCPRSLVVTGAVPGDGSSTVALHLAATLARGGNRVLLVDGDLRRPRIARRLGLPDGPGLTDVLTGAARPDDVIRDVPRDDVPRSLSVLPPGPMPSDPGELLGSSAMPALLDELVGLWDHVVVDAPPVLAVSDAALLGALTDGCVLVVRAGRRRKAQVTDAATILRAAHATLLGVVLDRVPKTGGVVPGPVPAPRSAGPSPARAPALAAIGGSGRPPGDRDPDTGPVVLARPEGVPPVVVRSGVLPSARDPRWTDLR